MISTKDTLLGTSLPAADTRTSGAEHYFQIAAATSSWACLQDLLCAPRPMQCGANSGQIKELRQLVAGPNDVAWNAEYGAPCTYQGVCSPEHFDPAAPSLAHVSIILQMGPGYIATAAALQCLAQLTRLNFVLEISRALSGNGGCPLPAGLPSSHTSLTLTYFLTLTGLLYQHNVISHQSAMAASLASFIWGMPTLLKTIFWYYQSLYIVVQGDPLKALHAAGAWIGVGRIYTIMHSLADVLAGMLLAVLTVCAALLAATSTLGWMSAASFLQPVALAVGSMLVYPKPQRRTPSFLDAVAFNGAALGVAIGARFGMHVQPPLDIRSWPHFQATLAQVLVGLLICGLAKEAVGRMAQACLGVVFGFAPRPLRALWQLPVHDERSMASTPAPNVLSPRHLAKVRYETTKRRMSRLDIPRRHD